jgi:hypothetical protein
MSCACEIRRSCSARAFSSRYSDWAVVPSMFYGGKRNKELASDTTQFSRLPASSRPGGAQK